MCRFLGRWRSCLLDCLVSSLRAGFGVGDGGGVWKKGDEAFGSSYLGCLDVGCWI